MRTISFVTRFIVFTSMFLLAVSISHEATGKSQETHTLYGFVYINGTPAWEGFGVKATRDDNSAVFFAVVEGTEGRYEFKGENALPEGIYVIDYDYPCPAPDIPMNLGIPAVDNRGPNIHIECPTHKLHGNVYINDEPVTAGFGVKASINGWGTRWATVVGDEGYYEFTDLIEGDYLIDHEYPCDSNMPTGQHVPAADEQGPNLYLDCPDLEHPLFGYVYINGKPAWSGFGVEAVRKGGTTKVAFTDVDGKYEFTDENILTEGQYTIRHNYQDCPSNNDIIVTIPAGENRGPDFVIECLRYPIHGFVSINGSPAPPGFGVKAMIGDETFWTVVEGTEGRYDFEEDNALLEGEYTIHHDHPCPSDTPKTVQVPVKDNTGPDINLTCVVPTYPIHGFVIINGEPAPEGFGVKATFGEDGVIWAVVRGDDGLYEFKDENALPEGEYVIDHDHPCRSNTPITIHVPVANSRGPDVNLTCVPGVSHWLFVPLLRSD